MRPYRPSRRRRHFRLNRSENLAEPLEKRVLLATYVVSNVNDSGSGSLRAAILSANSNAGLDFIDFSIPGSGVHTIAPTTPLPTITDSLFINGDTQPGYAAGTPLIELDGGLAGAGAIGLEFTAGGNWVEGLVIHSFAAQGIVLAELGNPNAVGGSTLVDNFIGTDPTGTVAMGNGVDGIALYFSPHNMIRGNLISANLSSGIFLADRYSTDNHIEANLIGTDITGTQPLGNALNGIALAAPNIPALRQGTDAPDGYASGNVIGGPSPELGNLISGNGNAGVYIFRGSSNEVQGNYIGTDRDGMAPIPNGTQGTAAASFGAEGIFIEEGGSNTIGGVADGAGNLVSGNLGAGVRISAFVRSAADNFIQGNRIGTDRDGMPGTGMGNGLGGVEIRNESADTATDVVVARTVIGGTDADDGATDGVVKARNIISGNGDNGILVAGHRTTDTSIKGNYIGTDKDGAAAAPNAADGIHLTTFVGQAPGTSTTLIGGSEPGAENLISGNGNDGIFIGAGTQAVVVRNIIGTNKDGTAALGNTRNGIFIFDSSNNSIGATVNVEGTDVALPNLISANGLDGVQIGGNSTGNKLLGNLIGMDVTGTSPDLGNQRHGIAIFDGYSNIIGDATALGRNVVVNSGADGIVIDGEAANGNLVQGNYIGLGLDGQTPFGNALDGVVIVDASLNTIGGTVTGAANFICDNGQAGVHIQGAAAFENGVLGNRIGLDATGAGDGNRGGGIYIDGAAGSLIGDPADSGPNVIADNLVAGIILANGAAENQVINNIIGADPADLNTGIPNQGFGILVVDSANNWIGSLDVGAGNWIGYTNKDPNEDPSIGSGHGISIQGVNATGNHVVNNAITANAGYGVQLTVGASGNVIGGPTVIEGNLISINARGVSIEDQSHDNTIRGNLIGTDAIGDYDAAFGNTLGGVVVQDASSNTITGNTIRGNGTGIGMSGAETQQNLVQGNTITNSTGHGVQIINGASYNHIGGTTAGARNLISINSRGVSIESQSHTNDVTGNYIGTNEAGDYEVGSGNALGGVVLEDAPGNTITGNTIRGNGTGVGITGTDAQQNVIQGNVITNSSGHGVQIINGASNNQVGGAGAGAGAGNLISINARGVSIESQSHDNTIRGNQIGTNDAGAFEAGFGNSLGGVVLEDAYHNTISGNTIRGNDTGVGISGADARQNVLRGNTITNSTGNGVYIINSASDNVLGGLLATDGNIISDNAHAGVVVASGTGDAILHNRIVNNGRLGIDLGDDGVTLNDTTKDSDTGANNLQNFPELTYATVGGSQRITGTLKSAANSTYTLEFFATSAPDGSGFGQAERFLTFATVTTNAGGIALFDVVMPAGETAGTYVTATATDAGGNTSEFARTIRIQQDSDGDGIPDTVEDNGPNSGDGNQDGVPDSQQQQVASYESPAGGYVTLELGDSANGIAPPPGAALTAVRPVENPSPDDAPAATGFALGLVSYSIVGLAPGGSAIVTMILPFGSSTDGYYRYGPLPWDPTPQWYDWSYDGTVGAIINGNRITLNLLDGGTDWGDDDLTANGIIVDPGGPTSTVPLVVSNTLDSGPGSLRQAIRDANNHSGADTIVFNIGTGVQTIMPLSDLPAIYGPLLIDGTTQPGFAGAPIIELSGQSDPSGTGLLLYSDDITVRGLVINRFVASGITVANAYQHRDVIEGNYIGTDVTGMLARPNGVGVTIGGGYDVRIGGTTAAQRNIISGNTHQGIYVDFGSGHRILGNYVGVAADGIAPLGNGNNGVAVGTAYSIGNTLYTVTGLAIGGLDPGAGNIIAFNGESGVQNRQATGGNSILSNAIYGNHLLGISYNTEDWVLLNERLTDFDQSSRPPLYPVMYSAQSANGQTTIKGYLDSQPNAQYLIQFFSNSTVPASGFGQGQSYVGSTTVTTDANGHVDFTAILPVEIAYRQILAATATDSAGNTSQFSRRLGVGEVPTGVFTVNTTDDVDDGIADATHTSLREAIQAADNYPGASIIRFAIGTGVQTIAPLTPLPAIVHGVTLDGWTQPGFAGTPIIELSGAAMERQQYYQPSATEFYMTALALMGDNITIRGLVINNFYEFSIITGNLRAGGIPLSVSGNNNVIEGNYIGTNVAGTAAVRNLEPAGIGGANNRIGGPTPQQRNLFSGNWDIGGLGISGHDNIIQGNYIGTDVTGNAAIPNGRGTAFSGRGVTISGANNLFGGSGAGEGNLVSGNLGDGLVITGHRNVIQGNRIGTNAAGTARLANAGDGIAFSDNTSLPPGQAVNTIGGSLPGQGNLISGNRIGITVGLLAEQVIQGNYIGTDITGTYAIPNTTDGIYVVGNNHLIGGTEAGAGNLISGNGRFGILVTSVVASEDPSRTYNIRIQGNRIGTQADGISALGNGSDGIVFAADFTLNSTGIGPADSSIGGTEPGAGNTIAFNGRNGINILAGERVAILSNSISSNAQLGIDLNGNGVTANDAGDADSGDNDLQNYPIIGEVITDGTRSTISGTLNSLPNTQFLLQFYTNAAADPSGFGEGQTLLRSISVTTDSAGDASFLVMFSSGLPVGQFVTATATDPSNNSSEFSLAVQVASGIVDANFPPTASAGGPYTINEGAGLALDASASQDPDGDPLSYSWDVNGDGVFGDAAGVAPTLSWQQLVSLGITDGPGAFTLSVRVDDGQGHEVTSGPASLTVVNVAPTADAGPDQSVNEGDPVTLAGSFTDPGTADTHTFLWQLYAPDGQLIADGHAQSFQFVPADDGSYFAVFTVSDDDGGQNSDTLFVNVANVAPALSEVSASVAAGGLVNLQGTITDPGLSDTFTLLVDWGDGSDPELFPYAAGTGAFRETHLYADTTAGYTIGLTLSDDDGGQSLAETPVAFGPVGNSAPVITQLALSASSIDEGGTVTVTGSYSDADPLDTHSVLIDWGDGTTTAAVVDQITRTFSAARQYLDDDPTATPADAYTITATVTDSQGAQSDPASAALLVRNVAPVLGSVAASTDWCAGTVCITAPFQDAGTLDTQTAEVDWGDGSTTPATVLELPGGGKVRALHTYAAAGIYQITLTLRDDDGGQALATQTVILSGAAVHAGILEVIGTPAADQVEVSRITCGDTDVYRVQSSFGCNSVADFPAAGITGIRLLGCDGDDYLAACGAIGIPMFMDGGAGDDTLIGGDGKDTLYGNDGADQMDGRAGDDEVYGGAGNDTLRGGDGNDVVCGQWGDDVLYGNFGDDTLDGEDGADELRGGLGADSLRGGTGDDRLYGGNGSDTILGNEDDDYIEGRGKADRIEGGTGNDTIWGGAGSDWIAGGEGDDWIDIGYFLFGDTVDGGAGYDTVCRAADDSNDSLLMDSIEKVLDRTA